MTTLREAAQQALEFVTSKQWGTTPYMDVRVYEDAARLRDTLRAALEEPEQAEPVAWCDIEEDGTIHGLRYWSEPGRREHALYTHPPRREWRGLTEDELGELMRDSCGYPMCPNGDDLEFARALDAALRSKNHD